MTEFGLLTDLGYYGLPRAQRQVAVSGFPPPRRVIVGIKLWDPGQCLDILSERDPAMRFKVMARRFIVGEFLPEGYRYRPVKRQVEA